MFKKASGIFTKYLSRFYLRLITSVAFYPTLIAIGLFLLSLLTLYIDQQTPSRIFGNEIPFKNIISPSSARALLGGISGGLISLMVFSFSMVMLILSQASSSYSPRLLPNMIEKRHHQVVLGVYLGTIAYTFVVLSSIQSLMYSFGVPTLSVVINAMLCILCLALFISFINNISQIIQIGNIISDLHGRALKGLEHEINKEIYIPGHELPLMNKWQKIESRASGYLDSIDQASLLKATAALDITIKVCIPLGQFVNRRDVMLLSSRPLNEQERQRLFTNFFFRHQENVSQNFLYGYKQLTEIATKALSPGINDPGTALQALDRLTDLLIVRMELQGYKIKKDQEENLRVIFEPVHFADLFYFCLGTVINYVENDLPVNHKLIQMLNAIAKNDQDQRHSEDILSILDNLVTHYLENFMTSTDKASLVRMTQGLISRYGGHHKCQEIQDKIAEAGLLKTI